jgi:hypothetical protein
MARREKKGARAETAARKKVSSSHRLFFQAAALSGLPSDKVCALMDFHLLSTAAAMELVEASMEHLPGRAVVLPTLDGVRTHLEHNWFLLRDSFNRMQRALEHGLHVLVHTLTMYILIMYTLKMYTLVMYTLILYTPCMYTLKMYTLVMYTLILYTLIMYTRIHDRSAPIAAWNSTHSVQQFSEVYVLLCWLQWKLASIEEVPEWNEDSLFFWNAFVVRRLHT